MAHKSNLTTADLYDFFHKLVAEETVTKRYELTNKWREGWADTMITIYISL